MDQFGLEEVRGSVKLWKPRSRTPIGPDSQTPHCPKLYPSLHQQNPQILTNGLLETVMQPQVCINTRHNSNDNYTVIIIVLLTQHVRFPQGNY